MTPERWREILAVFDAVVDVEPTARDAMLSDACGEDLALRDEVVAMIEADASSSLLDLPAVDALALGDDARRSIGRYQLTGPARSRLVLEDFDAVDSDGNAVVVVLSQVAASQADGERLAAQQRQLASVVDDRIRTAVDTGVTEVGSAYWVRAADGWESLVAAAAKLPVLDRIPLAIALCEALAQLHDHGLVHGTLTVDSAVVDESGRVVVYDGAIAPVLCDQPDRALLVPPFAAPELFRRGALSARSDVYALGAVIYQLLTGEPPFAVDDVPGPALARAIETASVRPLSSVSHELSPLDAVVSRCLAARPEGRYADASELAGAIRSARG